VKTTKSAKDDHFAIVLMRCFFQKRKSKLLITNHVNGESKNKVALDKMKNMLQMY
jgi:hypothetical protein